MSNAQKIDVRTARIATLMRLYWMWQKEILVGGAELLSAGRAERAWLQKCGGLARKPGVVYEELLPF
jgi:hypothetical protein